MKLNRTPQEEYRQVLFLHDLLRSFELKGIKRRLISILGITGILAALSLFLDLQVLVGVYFIIGIVWLIFLYTIVLKFLKYNQKKKRLKKAVEEEAARKAEYYLDFNGEWVRFTTGLISSEMRWERFRGYIYEENTVYLLLDQVSSTWSFSKEEIGEEALINLTGMVKEKVPPFKYKK